VTGTCREISEYQVRIRAAAKGGSKRTWRDLEVGTPVGSDVYWNDCPWLVAVELSRHLLHGEVLLVCPWDRASNSRFKIQDSRFKIQDSRLACPLDRASSSSPAPLMWFEYNCLLSHHLKKRVGCE